MGDVPRTVPIESLLEHRGFVRGLARSLAADDARADDVTQQTWLDALRRPPREDRGVAGWLARVVRRRARDTWRSERRLADAVARAAEERSSPPADRVVERAEIARCLVEAVMSLDEPFRTAILLRFYEGLPPREVAARTGVPVETARARVRRGLDRLRERFGADDPERGASWLGALAVVGADEANDAPSPRLARGSSRRAPTAHALRVAGVAATVAVGVGLAGAVVALWMGDDGSDSSGGGDGVETASVPATSRPSRTRRSPTARAERPREPALAPAAAAHAVAPKVPALAAPPPPAEDDVAGTWDLVMTRKGWQPEATTGRLVLERDGKSWKGSLTFDVVLNARRHELTDVKASSPRKLSFSIEETGADLRFRGESAGGSLSGTCKWKDCGDFPWTATRADGPPVPFEPGLTFDPDLPQGDAAKLGLDPAALEEMIRAAAKDDTDALVVVKDGKLVAERTFGRPPGEIHVMSVTKAITALALVKAIEDGKIRSLDDPVSAFLEGWDERPRSDVTLRHLVSHTSGLLPGKTAKELNEAKDKVAYVTSLPFAAEPGTRWQYNNEAVALLGGIVGKFSLEGLDGYAKPRIFRPCGVEHFAWDRDEAGNTFAYANLSMTARDLARVGWMVANDGKSSTNQRVLTPESIRLLGTPTTTLRREQALLWNLTGEPESKAGQALFHTGWLGQWIVVHPKARLVAVRLRRFKDDAGAARTEFEAGRFAARTAALVK